MSHLINFFRGFGLVFKYTPHKEVDYMTEWFNAFEGLINQSTDSDTH